MPLLADHLYTAQLPSIAGAGLLTTVDSLPAALKRHYPTSYKPKSVAIKRSLETPLDLTVKNQPTDSQPPLTFSSITPPSTPSPPPKKRYKFIEEEQQKQEEITETQTVIRDENHGKGQRNAKRKSSSGGDGKTVLTNKNQQKAESKQVTPQKPIVVQEDSDIKMGKGTRPGKKQKRNTKATRKLKFDEDTSSPVSGTIIRRLEDIEDEDQIGDIDPEYNIVEVTEEAKAEIAAIVNVIGDYNCKLCRKCFDDAFELARHRCSCIVLLEYRCPECGKRFNCPANLASHRRWHKPRPQGKGTAKATASAKAATTTSSDKYSCTDCKKTFKRLAYLKKHQLTHQNTNQVVVPVQTIEEDSHNSNSNASFYSHEDEAMQDDDRVVYGEEEEEVIHVDEDASTAAMETYNHHPTKLQAFTQIVFRYASSMHSHSDEEENIVYSPMSRGSTPESIYSSAPSPATNNSSAITRRTDDENLAAAALAALARNGSSVIRHTTLSV